MATIKAYTDIEQSKKLTEILPLESADMWWAERYAGQVMENGQYIIEEKPVYYLSLSKPSIDNYSQDIIKDIACWSLAALLNVIDQVKTIRNQRVTMLVGKYVWQHWYVEMAKVLNENSDVLVSSKELIDACYEMIIKLHEQKLL
ncbi:MAG: hypothetical protein IKO20_04010 [Bacteroidaceae bacterium]|nr:hypothetical protein [Bacteroidaceae bacterium]